MTDPKIENTEKRQRRLGTCLTHGALTEFELVGKTGTGSDVWACVECAKDFR